MLIDNSLRRVAGQFSRRDDLEQEKRMLIDDIHHTCVIVSDMERSLKFYRDTLGMKQEIDISYDADSVTMDLPGTNPKQ